MKISQKIDIDTVYTRSINIERDADSDEIVKAYIPTSRAINTLHRISETFERENTPRSWALIGPYGSGKSSFAVFLSHLMDNGEKQATLSAYDVLKKTDNGLFEKFKAHSQDTKGYLSILITGAPEPLGRRFLSSMLEAAQKYWNTAGRNPFIIKKIKEKLDQLTITTGETISLFKELQEAVQRSGSGILIIFDEFGKFLEYEARHYGANDIYILQLLSELAVNDKNHNLFVFTLMHQGFEEYAKGLSKTLRNEWSKIQGRFETVPFLETTEQTIHILSKAIINNLSDEEYKSVFDRCKKISVNLSEEQALPGSLTVDKATELFTNCYPLHPVTVLLLPVLCQKMAQNERTLFSYLGSRESFGFKDSLQHLTSADEWILPWHIYEYFIQNQPAVTSDPITHRRWAEVVTAVERLGDAPPEDVQMLKTIGLLNIIGAQAGFKASKQIIESCSENKKAVEISTKDLIKRSVVQFRKFSNEFRVWQGSDFELETALQDEIGQIGRFDLSETLEQLNPLQPVVAHRHTIENVTLRYFVPFFVDVNNYKKLDSKGSQQRLIFCLTETADEIKEAASDIVNYFGKFDIIAICPNGDQLRQAVAEVLALKRVEQNSPELNSDPIAQKEFKDRFVAAELSQTNLLSSIVESPEASQWYWCGEKFRVENKRELQKHFSAILDSIYSKSPIIKNELINRDKPSTQAMAARNKLVFSMLYDIEKEDLGIEKFPAEKGIYKSFLHATGLHQLGQDKKWKLIPPKKDNPYNLYPVWAYIEEFLETTQNIPKSFKELDERLQSPPYGVKSGVLPLLYLTVFLCKQNELAFYEDGIYTPYITDQHIERFMKRPDFFTVQLLRISGIRASLFNSYARVLYGENPNKKIGLLNIARPLAKFITELEDYTKQTNRLSDASQNALKAFQLANSPADLLFNKLPRACSFPEIDPDETNKEKIKGFTNALISVIKELRDAYKNMHKEFTGLISECLLPDHDEDLELPILREKIQARYEGLGNFTVDSKGLQPFIEHITEKKADDAIWFSRLLLFLGEKTSNKWTDIDRDNAVLRLTEYSKKLIDLRIIQGHFIKNKAKFKDSFEIIHVRSMRYGKSDNDEVITIDPSKKEFIDKRKPEFHTLLSKIRDPNTCIAILADILDEYLSTQKNNKEEFEKKAQNGYQKNRLTI
jgi:hypothetical protein